MSLVSMQEQTGRVIRFPSRSRRTVDSMHAPTLLYAVLLVLFVGKCLGGHQDAEMVALRNAFEEAGSLPLSWSGGVPPADSCEWPGVQCVEEDLTTLSLDDEQLTVLPPEIGGLVPLKQLWLGNNQLTTLPAEIGSLTSLVHLILGDNHLTRLPPEIGSLTSLTELDLGGNQLMSLPREIEGLTSLGAIYLGGNQLTSLPDTLWTLPSLRYVDLCGNDHLCDYSVPTTFIGTVEVDPCRGSGLPVVSASIAAAVFLIGSVVALILITRRRRSLVSAQNQRLLSL